MLVTACKISEDLEEIALYSPGVHSETVEQLIKVEIVSLLGERPSTTALRGEQRTQVLRKTCPDSVLRNMLRPTHGRMINVALIQSSCNTFESTTIKKWVQWVDFVEKT